MSPTSTPQSIGPPIIRKYHLIRAALQDKKLPAFGQAHTTPAIVEATRNKLANPQRNKPSQNPPILPIGNPIPASPSATNTPKVARLRRSGREILPTPPF